MKVGTVTFPEFTGARCLMMQYVQGDAESVPSEYRGYANIINTTFTQRGDIGYLTVDESIVQAGKPHRGTRAKYDRALHTEAGRVDDIRGWGSVNTWGVWAGNYNVTLDSDVQILLANNLDDSCAVWDATHEDTSQDGDIGYAADQYPYCEAEFLQAGDVHQIGIFTPHESLPVKRDTRRQFLRIVSSGVHGREPYFTRNPLMETTDAND